MWPYSVVMRLHVVLLAALVGLALARDDSLEGYRVFQLHPNEEQMDLLSQFEDQTGFDFWTRSRVAGRAVDIMVAPHQLQNFARFLEEHKIQNTVLIHNVQVVVDAERYRQMMSPRSVSGKISFNAYHRHDEINAYLDEMATTYPNMATVVSIGKTFQGRDMKVIKISKGGSNNPIVWIDAGIHAREWIAPSMSLYVINQLLENPANSALTDGLDWHILPVMNPDGYEYTHTNTRLWRKTRSTTASTTCPGADPNRNWDFHWMEGGSSSNVCSDTFAGKNAFSEPENVNVRNYLNTNKARTKMYLTMHSYGNYLLYPWGWTSALPTDWQELDDLAQDANAAQMSTGGDEYEIGTSTNVLYLATGGSDDWAKGVAGIELSYTIELPGGGPNGFDLPASQIQRTVQEFWAAIPVFGRYVQNKFKP